MKKPGWILLLWICAMIFPLNWLRRESVFVQRNFDAAFKAEWVHVVLHMILYAGLVALLLSALRLPLTGRSALLVLAILLAVAFTQESLQLIVKQRAFGGPEWFDLGVDLLGGAAGWWGYDWIILRKRLKQRKA